MGSALRLPVRAARESAADALADARRHGCRIIATVPRGGQSPSAIDLAGPVAIAIGGEGQGLAPDLVAAADARVSIPMAAPVESLNAAVTSALVLYEARRQRAEQLSTLKSQGSRDTES
jgi:TrmH family RNA methyltransferase